MTITLTLTPEQEAWLTTHVSSGEFISTEDAIRHLLNVGIADYADVEKNDLTWAKPHVDEALAELKRGEGITLEEHDAHIDALMAKLKG